MAQENQRVDEEFVKLALAINEHLPGYVDSYFGPAEWQQEAQQAGKFPLPDLTQRVEQLTSELSQANGWDPQRKDFLSHQIRAMQMSLRLLAGEEISLVEEVLAIYDVLPTWRDETQFLDYQHLLDEWLPQGDSLSQRLESWKKSLEISIEKAKELLPFVVTTLRERAHEKFDLPEDESFVVEFISDQPWMAYNRYLGGYRSLIEINTDLPLWLDQIVITIAHEGYPGHHTELTMKDQHLIRQKGYREHLVTLINCPSCVISEGIARSALETLFNDQELEDLYREEILPQTRMAHLDAKQIVAIMTAEKKINGLWGNAAFMLHDHKKSLEEVTSYLQKYEMSTKEEAQRAIRFMSGPLDRSYIFTYTLGVDLLNELFSMTDRDTYFERLLQEPVTPSQIRQWIKNESVSD